MIPERLGPYRLGRRLGRGGMGAVYEGINETSGERVAVKILSANFSHERDFRERFASEIETLRRLRHPHIVRLFGFGQQEDQLFYAMELVDGTSLEEELQQGRRFRWQEVLAIGQQTCDALRHAHDRGIIHRDIKPANLLLASDESVKLSDFGIAKLFGQVQLTAVGSVIGTIEYMAPEQADARPLDPRADLYSLGGVLYALLAGRAPLVANSLPEMLHKQRHEPPEPLARLVADVPRELAELIQQLLEKNPDRRVPNARLLARRLDAISVGLARRATQSRPPSEDLEPGKPDEKGDFLLGPAAAATPSDSDALGLQPTRALDEEDAPSGSSAEPRGPAESLPETLATAAFQLAPPESSPGESGAQPPDESSAAAEPTTRFTPVAEEELDQVPVGEPGPHPVFSVQTGVLVAALIVVALTIWYFLTPPSADTLYARIAARTADEDISSIRAAKGDIEQFLWRYSGDSRCGRLRKFQREIALDELESRFNLQVKQLQDSKGLLPIQKAYLEARNYLWLDPERGAAKLRAMIDLYGRETDPSGPTAQCLELAQRRLAKIEEEATQVDADYRALVQSRIELADTLADSNPTEAKKMYEAVVELYSTKPWAADAVRHAREALGRLGGEP